MDWYYAKDGQQIGPVTEENLRQLKANGQINGQTLIWGEGMAEWKSFSEALGEPVGAQQPPMAPIAQMSSYSNAPVVENHMTRAIVTTVLGMCCCYVSMILGIIAIVFAAQVNPAAQMGDYTKAQDSANRALQLSNIGLWLLPIGVVLTIIVAFIQIAAEM